MESPIGLSLSQMRHLREHAKLGAGMSTEELAAEVTAHSERTEFAYKANRMVNVRLANALAKTMFECIGVWSDFDPKQRFWLSGAILYFARCNDDEPDFQSPIGFEDDAEVLNACLRFAGKCDWCLSVEDYDDV